MKGTGLHENVHGKYYIFIFEMTICTICNKVKMKLLSTRCDFSWLAKCSNFYLSISSDIGTGDNISS